MLEHLDRWVHDPDFWIRRSAVLGLRTFLRRDQQLDRFFAYAEQLLPENEFFIRKVIGWVAREVAARHPALVSQWLRDNMAAMNLITLREPLRTTAGRSRVASALRHAAKQRRIVDDEPELVDLELGRDVLHRRVRVASDVRPMRV